jgi:hypothetical protein
MGSGFEIAKKCFYDWCLPIVLNKSFSTISERVAACILWGSQAIDNDDDISKDHGWGPLFELVLTEEDYNKYGNSLQNCLNESGKKDYSGYRLPPGSRNYRTGKSTRGDDVLDAEINVTNIPDIMRKLFNDAYPLQGLSSWKYMDESMLYFCRHGKIFYDPSQTLTEELKPYRNYPEAILKRRVCTELRKFCMFGYYNYERIAKRNDPITLSICRIGLINSTMTLVMLLNNDYTPYFKWLHIEFLKQSGVEELDKDLRSLLETNIEMQLSTVRKIEKFIYSRLEENGYSSHDYFIGRFKSFTKMPLEGILMKLKIETSKDLYT